MGKLLGCILLVCLAWGFLSKEQMEEMNAARAVELTPEELRTTDENPRMIASLGPSGGDSAWIAYRMKLFDQIGLTDAEVKRLVELDKAFSKARDEIIERGNQDANDRKKKKEWDLVLQRLEEEHLKQQMGVVGRKRFQILVRSLTQFRQVYGDLTGQAAPQNTW
ncbi:hypothetical protein [Bdellovibrio sp. HCB2-146]|uniref:hypothetical protein n=1 Tax=Bdellovibrio sp. HCB2-146 TaxID=3394362 RepID=UPI0039BD1641